MKKYHINAKGVPAVCRAKKGNCPYGGSDGNEHHFDTKQEAEEFAQKLFEKEHAFLPTINTPNEVPLERRVDLYHATSSQVLQRIMDEGRLAPASESGLTSNGYGLSESSDENGVYLANEHERVSMYLGGAVENGIFDSDLPNCGVVIELYVDSDNLTVDKDDYRGGELETATWEDSLEDCNQVVHQGEVNAGQIKSVTFKAPFNMGGILKDKIKSVSELAKLRRKVINGKKLTPEEAIDALHSLNKEVRALTSKVS